MTARIARAIPVSTDSRACNTRPWREVGASPIVSSVIQLGLLEIAVSMFPRPVATREEGKVYRIATGTSGRLLALTMDTLDGEVRLLDAVSLRPLGTLLLGPTRIVRMCVVSPDDTALVVATHDDVSRFDLGSGDPRWV